MIKIKAIDLVSIAAAAELWLRELERKNPKWKHERESATSLKKALQEVEWEEGETLFIDEMPF